MKFRVHKGILHQHLPRKTIQNEIMLLKLKKKAKCKQKDTLKRSCHHRQDAVFDKIVFLLSTDRVRNIASSISKRLCFTENYNRPAKYVSFITIFRFIVLLKHIAIIINVMHVCNTLQYCLLTNIALCQGNLKNWKYIHCLNLCAL